MSFSVTIRGVPLTQAQLDALVPVLDADLDRRVRMPARKLEQACIDALEKAGCPITGNEIFQSYEDYIEAVKAEFERRKPTSTTICRGEWWRDGMHYRFVRKLTPVEAVDESIAAREKRD